MTLSQSRFKNALLVALFVLPAFIPLFIFWVYPILRTFWLSFTDWNFMTPEYQFVQFSNYKSLLADSRFYEALKNTLVFTLGTLVPTILGGLTLAMLLQKRWQDQVYSNSSYSHLGLHQQ